MKKNNDNQRAKRAAFTIVELLTVMAVIAILIGLLVPALSLVHDTAKDLQQKAQFHGIEVGLELYKSQFGEYPESDDNQYDSIPRPAYTGANKLAEAMVGFDLMGFHPGSEFRADGFGPDPLGGADILLYDTAIVGNIDEREERFVDLEKANAYRMEDVYDAAVMTASSMDALNYVLCDGYNKRRESGEKTGMPILYFRADTKFKIQDSTSAATPPEIIFDYYDNYEILDLNLADDSTVPHELIGTAPADLLEFDDFIRNDQIQFTAVGNETVPYRAQSFILMSAGKDGVYGNADDVFNFEKEK